MSRNSKTNRKMKENLKAVLSNTGTLVLIVAACTTVITIILNWQTVLREISRLAQVLTPFMFGIVLAFLINPLVNSIMRILNRFIFKEKKPKACKYTSVAVAYAILIGALTIIIVYIVPQISESIKELFRSLETGYEYITNNTDAIREKYPWLPINEIKDLLNKIVPQDVVGYGTNIAKLVFPYIYSLSASFVSGFIDVLFAVVISCYIILDKAKILKSIRRIIYVFMDKKTAPVVWDTFRECNHIFNGFLYGKTIDSLIIGILCFVAMTVLQLPYALLFSVIVGVTNMIPYFGPFVGAIPGVLIFLVIEPKNAIIFAIMILILQQFDGLYLGPKILGEQTGIKPIWVIFAITVGGDYFGVIGMFLGVPTVAAILHIFNVVMERKIKARMRNERKKNIGSDNSAT